MPNRLANATSPYLLQHAENPVDWYEWGPEALQRARDEDKAILLSIGYSACHWCHVMAHESFEDPAIAASMNERFINIKVDREERPDLDHIYMSAVQAMTRSGGWPLTVFLTPDLEPFFGGTYFPPEPRHGIPSFPQTLEAVHQHWTERRDDCLQHGRGLKEWIEATTTLRAEAGEPSPKLLDDAVSEIVSRFDPEWGGFGPAPKFPQPMNLAFLLRRHVKGDARTEIPLRSTLTRMARGGIFDQLGGGFCRYSTDRVWLVPHFEKMLYDNAQLITLYTRAWQVFGDPLYARTVRMTVEFLLRELRLQDGGFASSLDADSRNPAGEMEEGAFYVFGYDELIAGAGDDMPIAVSAFALAGPGNWEGKNVLWRPVEDDELCDRHGLDVEQLHATIERVRASWFAIRETRPRPGRDDKVLAGWNGMTIGALAEAGRVFGEPTWIAAATAAAEFCSTNLRREDGRLLRAWRDGRTSGPGFLDDHAMLADGFLTLYETTGDVRWFLDARSLIEAMQARFTDARGGFHDTGDDAEDLLVRPKDLFDNAVPSGNAVAAQVLLRYAALEADPEPEARAASYLSMMAAAFAHSPGGFGSGLEALDRYLSPRSELAIVGDPADPRTKKLAAEADRSWFPDLVRAIGEPSTHAPGLLDHPKPDQPVAYLCERFACQMPTSDAEVLAQQLARS